MEKSCQGLTIVNVAIHIWSNDGLRGLGSGSTVPSPWWRHRGGLHEIHHSSIQVSGCLCFYRNPLCHTPVTTSCKVPVVRVVHRMSSATGLVIHSLLSLDSGSQFSIRLLVGMVVAAMHYVLSYRGYFIIVGYSVMSHVHRSEKQRKGTTHIPPV